MMGGPSFRYVTDPSVKVIYAESRNALAHTMRAIHSDNPAMARLLFRRYKEAKRQFVNEIMSGDGPLFDNLV
jgi:hypothetical protein